MALRHRNVERRRAGQVYIQVQRIGTKSCAAAVDRAAHELSVQVDVTRNDLDASRARHFHRRNLSGGYIPVVRRLHLFSRRQIEPQLKAAQAALGLLRHLRMNDAARGGHPLHIAGPEIAAVSEMVLVAHVAIEHVGDSLEAAMRM